MLADAEARRRILEDLGTTFFVEAAAGTGKTTALVGRIVALLRTGEGTLDRIVAVTFTEKAAGEMKLRLRAEIEEARVAATSSGLDGERRRFENALEKLELAKIGTIHAFCGDLLHERPVEAGVDPLFEVAPEDEAERLLDRAFDAWFQAALADPPEGVRRVLRRRPKGFDAQGPRQQLRVAAAALVEHRDFPAAWRRQPFDRETALDAVMLQLEAVGALADRASSADDYLARNLAEIRNFVRETAHREAVRPGGSRDYDGLEAELRELARVRSWRWRGYAKKPYGRDLPREDVLAPRDAAKAALDAFLEASDADLAPQLREELRPVVEAYEALKQKAGRLDFVDLLIGARDLLAGDRDVRAELQGRFSHFFVDEFQDTDPLQAEILLLLSGDDPDVSHARDVTPVPGKLFLVGDPKQSIYRFRRADVAIYEETKRRLSGRGAEVLHLSTSFRGVPGIQQAVNAAFAPHMQQRDDGSQAAYVPLERFREATPEQPAVVALPVPRPYGDYRTIVNFRIDQSLPDAVGAMIDWLVKDSGWRVASGEKAGEKIQPRHICLLFRRFKRFRDDVTRPYVRALEARRLPHVLVGGRSFHDREEVLAIRNALCAIEWPDDELRVFATLRGPLFALGDDALLAFRDRVGSFHPLRRVDRAGVDEAVAEVADALGLLALLHRGRNRRPIAQTIERLLGAVRAHAGIAIWPTGEQALANCLRVIDQARRFERRGAPSFRAFVERMEVEAERGDAQDAPIVEEGTEGVRIMTVHRAKGLEFPVVILADPTCKASRDDPSRHVDPDYPGGGLWAEPLCGCKPPDLLDAREEEVRRDAAEGVRLAYVAATRARDLLVVPVVGDEACSGWLDVLNPVVYPPHEKRREAELAPGCPPFGQDSVFERPPNVSRAMGASVAPGLQHPQAGDHTVVWWDPHALGLDKEEEVGLRQQRILEADESGSVAQEGIDAHERWQRARRQAREAGATPSLAVKSVTALAAEGEAEAKGGGVPVEHVELDRSGRPGGKRFGSLVHAVLAAVDLGADAEGVRATARAQGRLLGAADDEVESAAQAAHAALAHPLLRRAAESAAAGGLRRETPVLMKLPDGSLAEGIVDLAFREGGDSERRSWTVVDFKTDRELAPHRARYEAQVRLYTDAVSKATGEEARGVLLVV